MHAHKLWLNMYKLETPAAMASDTHYYMAKLATFYYHFDNL